eukprot:6490183-Amphidinium_carterae.1
MAIHALCFGKRAPLMMQAQSMRSEQPTSTTKPRDLLVSALHTAAAFWDAWNHHVRELVAWHSCRSAILNKVSRKPFWTWDSMLHGNLCGHKKR